MPQAQIDTGAFAIELYDGFADGSPNMFLGEPEQSHDYAVRNVATCPDCGAGMVRLGSCFSCPVCGFGGCGVM
jgi:hypothetical protein